MKQRGTLIFFCGKMGAGKTTLSKQVAAERNAVLLSEDEWLAALYPGQINSFDDYRNFAGRLKPLLMNHVKAILEVGTDVVMDFPANTAGQRKWFRDLVAAAEAAHELLYLNVSNEVCLRQIGQRRIEQPERAAFDTAEMFHHVTGYFEEPRADEGFNIRQIDR